MANKYTASIPPDKEFLELLYHEMYLTQVEIASLFNVSHHQIQVWFKKQNIKARVAAKRFQSGSDNHSWKGDNATYAALHLRVQAARGKATKCIVCKCSDINKVYHWANLTGNYNDINDYAEMCVSCHHRYDNKINNITKEQPLVNKRTLIDQNAKLCTTL